MTENERAARQKKISHIIMWIVLLILFICFILPFILVVINVFKTKADITMNPLALIGAHGFTFKNFPEAMKKMNFFTVFGNSFIITLSATILTIVFSSMMAFVIVRNGRWKLCTLMFSLMVASMVIPFQVLMVPLVSVYGGLLGVLNHRITLILLHVGFSVSMAVFMFHGAIKTNIPLELEEAATIDGAGHFRILISIIIPAIKSAMIVVALLLFIQLWNDLLQQMIYINTSDKFTIAIGLSQFKGSLKSDWSAIMCATCMSFIPGIIFYLIGQKYFVEGIVMTGMKN